jgi:hypothetical protein
MNRRYLFRLLASVGLGGVAAVEATAQGRDQVYAEHLAWVSDVLRKMQEIRPGMSRERLLTVFTTEGGLSTGLGRTYVSRECPYFKVSVEFQAVGRPNRDNTGRVTLVEDNRDSIITISRPYLEFSIMD